MVHALIWSMADYDNAIYAGLTHSCINRLQSVFNAAVRLIRGIAKFGPVSCGRICIEFKILMLMRNYLAGSAPSYLRELCVSVSSIPGRRFLRSATQGDLVVPPARTSTVQHRSFAVVGPSSWNKLPNNLRHELLSLSLPLFRKRLKTILFDRGFIVLGRERLWWVSLEVALYKFVNMNCNVKYFSQKEH